MFEAGFVGAQAGLGRLSGSARKGNEVHKENGLTRLEDTVATMDHHRRWVQTHPHPLPVEITHQYLPSHLSVVLCCTSLPFKSFVMIVLRQEVLACGCVEEARVGVVIVIPMGRGLDVDCIEQSWLSSPHAHDQTDHGHCHRFVCLRKI